MFFAMDLNPDQKKSVYIIIRDHATRKQRCNTVRGVPFDDVLRRIEKEFGTKSRTRKRRAKA